MRLFFLGWYDRGNCGDEAFKDVHRQLFGDHDLAWICDRPPPLQSGDRLVLGGGDVFSPYYLEHIPRDENFWVYGVGLGGEEQRQLVIDNKHRIKGIWLRNRSDVRFLNSIGVESNYTPDIVFNLRELLPFGNTIKRARTKKLYVILSNNLAQDALRTGNHGLIGYFQFMKQQIGYAVNALGEFYDTKFVPFSTDADDLDLSFCADAYAYVTKRSWSARPGGPVVSIQQHALTPLEMIEMLSDADLIVSMKFHGLIFSTLLGVPFVNIGLSRKNREFCFENGLGDLCMDEYSLTKEKLEARIKTAEAPEMKAKVREVGIRLAAQAAAAAAEFRSSVLA